MYFHLYRENDENVAQNLAWPPLAVVCSEAILWSVTSQFAAHVKCYFTEKIIWQVYNKSMKSNCKNKVGKTKWNGCWHCIAKFSQRMYGGCGIPLLQSGKSHFCRVNDEPSSLRPADAQDHTARKGLFPLRGEGIKLASGDYTVRFKTEQKKREK